MIPGTFDERLEKIALARNEAINAYEAFGLEEADAEHRFRVNKATTMAVYRDQGKAQEESIILAESDAAEDRKSRDMAAVKRQASRERINQLEASRAMLREQSERERAIGGMGSG